MIYEVEYYINRTRHMKTKVDATTKSLAVRSILRSLSPHEQVDIIQTIAV